MADLPIIDIDEINTPTELDNLTQYNGEIKKRLTQFQWLKKDIEKTWSSDGERYKHYEETFFKNIEALEKVTIYNDEFVSAVYNYLKSQENTEKGGAK